jgi:hypothetical protein
LSYLDEAGAAHDLWILGEFYDGNYFDLDLDLGPLAGQQVRFVISVNDLGTSRGDRALWVAPRVVRSTSGSAPQAPAASPSVTTTPTSMPPATPALTVASPSPAASSAAPGPAPIPQFFESVLEFFRRLFGGN